MQWKEPRLTNFPPHIKKEPSSEDNATLFFFILSLRAIALNYRGIFVKNKKEQNQKFIRESSQWAEENVFLCWNQHLRKFHLLKQLLAVIVWHAQELSTTDFKQSTKQK